MAEGLLRAVVTHCAHEDRRSKNGSRGACGYVVAAATAKELLRDGVVDGHSDEYAAHGAHDEWHAKAPRITQILWCAVVEDASNYGADHAADGANRAD